MSQIKSITSILKEFNTAMLRDIWNEYCNKENPEGYIYYNEEEDINEIFHDNPYEAIRVTQFGQYNIVDDYFVFNTYGNITSFNENELNQYIDFCRLAKYVRNNGCDEITKVWYENIKVDFINYVNEKMNSKFNNVDAIPAEVNLVKDDWDRIIENYFKK